MIRVNLLPHREEKRKARRQQFYALLGLISILVGLIWFLGFTVIDRYIQVQESKNVFIEGEIKKLEKEIADIAKLKEDTEALLKRKKVIETLQGSRAETARMFDEVLRRIPEGVRITSFTQNVSGDSVNFDLAGESVSEARVSSLMRNLEDSPMFQQVNPIEIRAASSGGRAIFNFQMKMIIERPLTGPAGEGKPANKPNAPGKP